MGLIKEFREFAMKGNVVDLAVGVIIGGAFGGIVQSFIKDIVMPVVGLAGSVDFSNKQLLLKHANPVIANSQDIYLRYGNFITIVLNFIILAFCIFMMVKAMNKLRRKEEAKPVPAPGPTPQEKLLGEIRDLLAQRR